MQLREQERLGFTFNEIKRMRISSISGKTQMVDALPGFTGGTSTYIEA